VKFGVYESAEDYGKVTPPKAGEYSWHELSTGDYKAAFAFYSALFGWEKMAEHDMGEMGVYFIYGLGGTQLGGFFNAPPGAPKSWLGYVRVKDVHQAAKKVKSAGGKVTNGPMEVPGGDWIVQGVDKQGAVFAVHTLAADVKKPAAPAAAAAPAAPEAAAAEAPAAAEPAPEPAKKAAPKPAAKKPAAKKPAAKAAAKPAAKKAAKPAAKKPAQAAKKSAKKAAKKAAKKPAAKAAAKAAKKSAKKGGKKVVMKKSSGGKKKPAKKPRKGK
jgi:predicted enzyme related to lactoylglutathione lyase